MKRIFALLAIAFATLLTTTAPANAQYGAVPNAYGLAGAFSNITTTGFTLQLNATPGFPSGQPFEIFYDLTAVPQCGNAFVDVPGNSGVLTGTGHPYSQTINVTFPTPLTGGYVFYGNILLGTKGTVVPVPFPSIGGTGQLNTSVPSSCTPVKPPMLTCGSHNSGTVGVAFNSGPISVTGGTAPYTFSIAIGSLPAGLTLNTSTGAVTGTPTAAGSFAIKVTDKTGLVGTGTCPITIVPPPQLVINCASNSSGTVGVAFNSGPISVTGGTAPYNFSIASGTLPAGLTLNTSTGAVTGTPTAAGSATIKVTDSHGLVGTTTCPITIVAPPPSSCPTVIANALGAAGPSNFTLLSLGGGGSQIRFSSGTVQGNAGIANSGNWNESGSSVLTGALYLAANATEQTSGGSEIEGGILKNQDALLNPAATAAFNASNSFASMPTTLTVPGGNINLSGGGSQTVSGIVGTNVLNLTAISMSGGSKLTLSAPAGSQFIINISGQFHLSGSSDILLQGGITPYDVVFNETTGQDVTFDGGSTVYGIVLAPTSNITPDAGTLVGEAIGAANGRSITIASGEVVLHPKPCQ